MKNNLIFYALFLFGVCHATQGQNAKAILQHSSSAMGCAIVTGSTTVRVAGSLKAGVPGTEMPVVILSEGFDRWRSEIDTSREHKVTVVNQGVGQIQHQDGRTTKLAVHNTSHQRPTFVPCLSTLNSPPGQSDATYLRSESVPGDTLDVIEVFPVNRPALKVLGDRTKTTFWISRATGYVLRTRYINAAEQNSNDVEEVDVYYADYRVISGLAVPFTQRTSSGGKLIFELTLNSVQLNTPPADFTLR